MIDTLQTKDDLAHAGIQEAHAAAIAKAIGRREDQLVSKDFLKGELAQLETRMLWKIGAMILLASLLQFAAILAQKLIP